MTTSARDFTIYRFPNTGMRHDELPTNLTVAKTREYVWRCNVRFGFDDMNWITCWHVIDADTGLMIEGGYSSGNNQQSGHPNIERKRDAQAFIDGWMDEINGVDRDERDYVIDASGKSRPAPTWRETGESYKHGRRKVQSITKTGIYAPGTYLNPSK